MSHILGLDPGLDTTGYGVLNLTDSGPVVAEAGVLRSDREGTSTDDLPDRVKVLYEGLIEILDQWKPVAIAVEQLYAHVEHPRTAILMAHARGCYLLAGAQRGIPVFSYAATKVKKTLTGSGRASKEQMQHGIRHEFHLSKLPEPPDVADALAVAFCHVVATGNARRNSRGASYTGVNLKRLLEGEATSS
jgi:crossover junction endodeoxyribonuclease RuvC